MNFKTTHTGSLPRPQYLLDLMFAREGGEAVDQAALDEAIDRATADVLDRQKQAGVSVIGDGEMSKPSYATYIKHRLSGFGGEAGQYEFEDLEQFPGAKARVFGDTGRSRRTAPACTAPSASSPPATVTSSCRNGLAASRSFTAMAGQRRGAARR